VTLLAERRQQAAELEAECEVRRAAVQAAGATLAEEQELAGRARDRLSELTDRSLPLQARLEAALSAVQAAEVRRRQEGRRLDEVAAEVINA
jgi:hypothetical protein